MFQLLDGSTSAKNIRDQCFNRGPYLSPSPIRCAIAHGLIFLSSTHYNDRYILLLEILVINKYWETVSKKTWKNWLIIHLMLVQWSSELAIDSNHQWMPLWKIEIACVVTLFNNDIRREDKSDLLQINVLTELLVRRRWEDK